MSNDWEKIGEVRETQSLRVAGRGNGLYLFLPKGLCEVHGIIAGDRIRVQLRDHFRLKGENVRVSEKEHISPRRGGEREG